MTSANSGTYPRQYPCDGWVDNLEQPGTHTVINYDLFSDSGTQSEESN